MSREVTHDETGPALFDEDDVEDHGGTIAVCQCGLSGNKPFCDGSHTVTADEDDDAVYKYENDDDEDERHEIKEIRYADD